MNESALDRKIAVILIADAVGYSKHIERDETETIKSYEQCEAVIKHFIKEFNGSIFNTGGDSVLAEFSSAVNAVNCGVAFQKAIKERNALESTNVRLEFRLGINMGDVVQTKGNLLGDGVNVAARLETLCLPGSISISKNIHDLVCSKTSLSFNDQGIQKVKNNEFHVFDILIDTNQKRSLKTKPGSNMSRIAAISAVIIAGVLGVLYFANDYLFSRVEGSSLSLDTIAVVPLDVQADDDMIKSLAVGLIDDVVSKLNQSELQLTVKPVDGQAQEETVAEEMGAHYLLSGKLLSSGKLVRANMTLKETDTGNIIWSDTFNGDLTANDIFTTQDKMVYEIVDTLTGNGFVILRDAFSQFANKKAAHLNEFECIIGALNFRFLNFTKENYKLAVECLTAQLEDKKNNSVLHAQLADVKLLGIQHLIVTDAEEALKSAIKHANQAVRLNPQYHLAHFVKGRANYFSKEWAAMYKSLDEAIRLAPNSAVLQFSVGSMYIAGGECALDKDVIDGKFTDRRSEEGDCRWGSGYDLIYKAQQLDTKNFISFTHYFTTAANQMLGLLTRDKSFYELAYNQIQKGKNENFWYHLHSANSAAGWGKSSLAQEHYEDVKKFIGSNSIEDVYAQHVAWNVEKHLWLVTKSFLSEYGFE